MKNSKKFRISRFSYLTDIYDNGITASEIENMLNKVEKDRVGFTKNCAIWKVEEIK